MRRFRGAVVAAAAAALVMGANTSAASADGGSFVNVVPGAGQYALWYVDVSATSDTCPGGASSCSWFPFALVFPAAQACNSDANGGSYVWVGAVNSGFGTQTVPHEDFYAPGTPPLRFCLYVYKNGANQLTAEATYDGSKLTLLTVPGVPQPTPPPAAAPAPTQPSTPSTPTAQSPRRCADFDWQEEAQAALDSDPALAPTLDANGDGIACAQLTHEPSYDTPDYHPSSLGKREAAGVVRHALWKRYGTSFTARRGYRRSCGRLSRIRVRCRVSWKTSSRRYGGRVTVWTSVTSEGKRYYNWSIRVKRNRLAPPKPQPAPSPTPGPPSGGNCDPNYSGCLDPNAYDYDCIGGSGDGPRYTGTVVVKGTDHYGLDADGDGIGCE